MVGRALNPQVKAIAKARKPERTETRTRRRHSLGKVFVVSYSRVFAIRFGGRACVHRRHGADIPASGIAALRCRQLFRLREKRLVSPNLRRSARLFEARKPRRV